MFTNLAIVKESPTNYLYILFHSDPLGLCCQIQISKNEPPIRLRACEPYNRSPNTCSIMTATPMCKTIQDIYCICCIQYACWLIKWPGPNPMPGNILLSRSVSCGDAPGMGGYLPAITSSCDTAGAAGRLIDGPSVEAIKWEGPTQSHWNIENHRKQVIFPKQNISMSPSLLQLLGSWNPGSPSRLNHALDFNIWIVGSLNNF